MICKHCKSEIFLSSYTRDFATSGIPDRFYYDNDHGGNQPFVCNWPHNFTIYHAPYDPGTIEI